jgi:hypothetical protein
MAKSTFALPRLVSRTLASSPQHKTPDVLRLSQSQCRHFHPSPPRKEEKLSFRGQLYESTAQRLARERAEEARFAANRDAAGNSTLRLFATTFGMWDVELAWGVITGSALTEDPLTLQSYSAPQASATFSGRWRQRTSQQPPPRPSTPSSRRSTTRGTR